MDTSTHRSDEWAAGREVRLESFSVSAVIRHAGAAPNAIIAAAEQNTTAARAELSEQIANLSRIVQRNLYISVSSLLHNVRLGTDVQSAHRLHKMCCASISHDVSSL